MKATLLISLFCHILVQVTASVKPNIIEQHLGSCTPYRFISNKNDSPIHYPDCEEVKIWMIIRHGTRLSKAGDIAAAHTLTELKNEILQQHKNGKGKLTKEQLVELMDWTHGMDTAEDKFLTSEGQDEMVLLAERMQNRFPNIIEEKYNNKTYLFRHTATQRTHQSARYFTYGLFDKKDSQNVVFAPTLAVDKVLRFYKHCDRWQKQVKKNPESYKEQRLYGTSQEMNDTLQFMSKRLGLSRVLPLETASIIYKMCGYETALQKHHMSPWCHAFDDKTIQVLEYYFDLKSYWLDGYGHELTYQQACVAIRHMLDSLKTEGDPKATFLFTHMGAILKVLTYLGLYKPESPLMSTDVLKDANWRTSNISSFAANLAFVLFRCKEGNKVLTLHQEKIIRLPMCSEDLCPLNKLIEYFEESVKKCDYDDLCRLDSNVSNANEANISQ